MVAVTGANGLLGSFIVRQLINTNTPFVALKRKGSDTSLLNDVQHKITWRDADVLDPVELEEALKDVTRVIHNAAVVSYNPSQADFIMNVNVMGTRHIVDACLSMKMKRLVHISSVAALGRQRNQKFLDETNQWIDNPLHSTYARSKYLAELEVFRGQEEGLNTVIVNPSLILAPADWDKSSARLFKYVWQQKPFYTDGFLNYVDVRDVAKATDAFLNNNIQGQRFILSAGNISYKNFFSAIAVHFKKKPPTIKLTPSLLKLAAKIESIRTSFSKEEPLITKETARFAGTEFLYSNDKIKETLGFDFQPFDTSIAWCCQYYLTKFSSKK